MIFWVRHAFLRVLRLQLPNERVSFGAPFYVGRGHSWILPPTSPLPSNQSIAKILWTSRRAAPAGGTRRQPGSSAPGVQSLSLPDCRRAPPPPELPPKLRRPFSSQSTPPELPDSRFGSGRKRPDSRSTIHVVVHGHRRVEANVPFPQFFSTMAVITPTMSLYLLWKYQRRQTQTLLYMIHNIFRGAHSFWPWY
jgi:hypothetical protein